MNHRLHDIRHKVVGELTAAETPPDRETLAAVVRDIAVFDTTVATGNEALDTILTEKSLTCARRGVTLSCIADGTALAHLSAADLYALFSALIDGAVEAVCALGDQRLRSISLTLRRVGDLALIHVQHYGAGTGGGTVLDEICTRYGGTCTIGEGDGSCSTDLMLPIP